MLPLGSTVFAAMFLGDDGDEGGREPRVNMRYSRGTTVAAARLLGTLGHTEIDDLLLEWGVPHLNAGREVGSRAQRGVAIGRCAVENPAALTADGQPLAEAVVERALMVSDRVGDSAYDEGGHCAAFKAAFSREPQNSASVMPQPHPALPTWSRQAEPERKDSFKMPQPAQRRSNRVFLVHGRDDAAKDRVTLFLTRLGLETVILHEQANGGRTLLSKFLEEASTASFAVVLMTPDDHGSLVGENAPKPRARQNVVFELGFFVGSLGAERVCALVETSVERPSDFEAIAYVPFSRDSGWERLLARELREAGMQINMEALLR